MQQENSSYNRSTTVGNLITIQKEGKASIIMVPPNCYGLLKLELLLVYCLPEGGSGGSTSKKLYTTNKGNTY